MAWMRSRWDCNAYHITKVSVVEREERPASIVAIALAGANDSADNPDRLSAELRVGALWHDIPIRPNHNVEGDHVLIRHGRDLEAHLAPVGAMADQAIPARLRVIAGQPAMLAHQALAGG